MKQDGLVRLLKSMTMDEKINQLIQLAATFYSEDSKENTGPIREMGLTEENVWNAGSILGQSGAAESIKIQRKYMEKHRLGVPVLFMADVIHGFRTIFPIPLALGCSWDLEMAVKVAEISAREASVSGVHVVFSPMADLVRDPRWGRVMESTGEDPLLNSFFATAFVKGYQGKDPGKEPERVAACVKHYAGYGAVSGGREYNTVNMSERQLRESYLSAYHAAIEAGVKVVMTSFNTVDGIPATGNAWLLRRLLREEQKFEGIIISDWGAVEELTVHAVAKDRKEAALLALKAGVDIEMMTSCYAHHLEELAAEEPSLETLLDQAVMRVLKLKNDLGLFEDPFRGADPEKEERIVLCQEHRQVAREAALKSIVLLKNDGILPVKEGVQVAVIGPGAASKDILGAWSWQGRTQEAVSMIEGAKKIDPKILTGSEPFDYIAPSAKAVSEAVQLAERSEVVILALGEPAWMSGEAASRSDIRLPESQLEFFRKVRKINKNVIVVLYNGRPLDLQGINDANGIVEAWFPGTEGGHALAEVLWGKFNPCGRLCMSFPEQAGQLPIYYNADNTGRPAGISAEPKYISKYLDVANEAKYAFGFGLSYSEFHYGQLVLDKNVLASDGRISATIEVENRSKADGLETVQLYIRDLVGEVVRPIKELKDFRRLALPAGQKCKVTFTIEESMLRYFHSDQSFTSDAGEFDVMIGPDSANLTTQRFRLIK
ncbi:glycoside hydrolase family 3 N-terminal domain-containing protein [[Clostridium] hylemonae]|uniref:glycoside hydrolase family 3 N-terminal domain-containing protein n=1 Tax=[Clostridium] hylemonae TaxID=89153 RepID=UPI001FCBE131|nr:glycoside hydrolase family 3 N-terminal domain-containing protein [[Clostridium] hylemonae]BDF03004.1 beta-glucosidase [[Clostridium] hylemonae]